MSLVESSHSIADKPPVRRPNNRSTLIYWLIDTRINKPFYCGKTVNPAHQRLANHKYEATHGNRKVHQRVRDCGDHIRIQVMETVLPDQNWIEREKHWIWLLRGTFSDNCNTADGGAGTPGRILSASTKAKLSARFKGKPMHSAATKEHLRQLGIGRKYSQDTIEKRRRATKGRKRTPEQCAAISARQKARFSGPDGERLREQIGQRRRGVTVSEETRAKMRAAKRGRKLTLEQRAAISERSKGRIMSPEAIAKSAVARTGAKRTPEQRARMSIAHKGKGWSQARRDAWLRRATESNA